MEWSSGVASRRGRKSKSGRFNRSRIISDIYISRSDGLARVNIIITDEGGRTPRNLVNNAEFNYYFTSEGYKYVLCYLRSCNYITASVSTSPRDHLGSARVRVTRYLHTDTVRRTSYRGLLRTCRADTIPRPVTR